MAAGGLILIPSSHCRYISLDCGLRSLTLRYIQAELGSFLRRCFNKSQICSVWTFDAKSISLILITLLDILLSIKNSFTCISELPNTRIPMACSRPSSDIRAISYLMFFFSIRRFYTSHFIYKQLVYRAPCAKITFLHLRIRWT